MRRIVLLLLLLPIFVFAQKSNVKKVGKSVKATKTAVTSIGKQKYDADTYVVKKGDFFATIAKKTGVSIEDLAEANPGVSSSHLQIGQVLKLKKDASVDGTEENLSSVSEDKKDPNSYVVQKGDFFSTIAKKTGVSVEDLAKANPGVSSNHMQIGQILVLPEKTKVEEKNEETKPSVNVEKDPNTYVVQKGDFFSTIAKKTGVSVEDLEEANPGVSSNHLQIGQVLQLTPKQTARHELVRTSIETPDNLVSVPTPDAQLKSSSASKVPVGEAVTVSSKGSKKQTYVVKKKETYASIAKKCGVSTNALKKANPSVRGSLKRGQVLILPEGAKNPQQKKSVTSSPDKMANVITPDAKLNASNTDE